MPNWLAVRRVLFIEGACNLGVFLAKLSVGLSTGSLALVGDAIHSLADLANNLVALVVVRLSSAPPDREHPYGHQKFETLAVFGLAVLLSVLAVEIVLRAVAPRSDPVLEHPWGLGVMVGVLFVNVGVTAWERRWARRLNSAILEADAKHTFADVLITAAVIVGWQFAARGHQWLDRVFALGVALAVMHIAYGLFRLAIPVLVDRIAHAPEALAEAVRPIDGVVEVRRVRSRWAGSRPEADVVISVAAELSTRQAHEVADAIERVLRDKFSIDDAIVHVEPEPVDATATTRAKAKPSSE